MSNSNIFQPNVNTSVKSDDLRRPDKNITERFFTKVVVVLVQSYSLLFLK